MTTMKNSGKVKDILSLVDESTAGLDLELWNGTLKDYLPMVLDHPEYNETAHARICRMIESSGVEFIGDKKNPIYKFFEKEMFGIDHVLAQVMEFFRAAGKGSDARRRLLLLMGPTSSAKSTFVSLIKLGLEHFSKTTEGKLFAIDGCPMFENPLNAIPHVARGKLKSEYGIIVEGELCPKCAYRLEHEFNGDFWKIPVKRVFMSEMNRVGIGTFAPADQKCLNGDSLVLTENGLTSIEKMVSDQSDNVILSDGLRANVSNHFFYSDREVKTIKTEYGYSITGTLNNPLLSIDSNGDFIWKNIEDISIGDSLVLSKGQGVPFITEKVEENPMNFEWCPVSALFLGLYIAEGNINGKYNVEITNYNENIHNIIKQFCSKYDLNYTEYPERMIIYGKKLVNTMKQFGFTTGAHIKYIPDCVFTSGYLKEFLCGMWLGDGNVGRHSVRETNEASYSTVSPLLAEQVHKILLMLGVPANKQYFPNVGTNGYYNILVSGERAAQLVDILNIPKWKFTRDFRDDINHHDNICLIPRIDDLVKNVYNNMNDRHKWQRYTVSTKNYGRRFSQRTLKEFIKHASDNNCDKNLVEKLEKLISNEYLFLPVKSIIDGKENVYDIEVPSYHYFIANGFISHNSQSQSELVGSVNFAKLESYGVESHPLAYNFDGELNISNRGVMEFIELLKVDPRFRYILLTLVQEKRIKTERFPLIYADLVPIGHSNETEYNRFQADKKEEALHDRLWLIHFPYNLKVDSEVKIYDKLINEADGLKEVHIAPHTLKTAAMFAVLSRLEEPKDKSVTILQKMHLYNDEDVDGFTKEDIKELQKNTEREGLDGISPRYIINRLSACLAKHGTSYITPITALRSIKEGLSTNAKLDDEAVEKLENLISLCVEEYNKIAMNEVQKAFFINFEYEIKNLLENYLDNVGAYLDSSKKENEWGEMVEPDEELMRNVEEKVEITSTGKDSFRAEVYRKMLKSKSEDGEYNWQNHPKLKEALQKQLFEERSDTIRLTVSSRNPEPEALKKLNAVIDALVENYGYTAESANELLRYVNNIMSRTR